jgi:hypothetical protein
MSRQLRTAVMSPKGVALDNWIIIFRLGVYGTLLAQQQRCCRTAGMY